MNILKGNFFLFIASFIWGTAFVAQAVGMEFIGPLTFTFVRFLFGAIVVLPLLIFFESNFFLDTIKNSRSLFLIFATSLALGTGATVQQYALLYTDVSNAAFITALYVPMVPLILKVIFKKTLHLSIWLAVLVCLVGLFFLTSENNTKITNFYDILLVFGAFCFAVQIILNDIYLQNNKTPFTFAFGQYLIILL